RVAGQAVVDEGARAALQVDLAVEIRMALEQGHPAFIGVGRGQHGGEPEGEQQSAHGPVLRAHPVTLSGTGLVLSIFVYQGIRMKNRKYTMVKICAASVRASVGGRVPR